MLAQKDYPNCIPLFPKHLISHPSQRTTRHHALSGKLNNFNKLSTFRGADFGGPTPCPSEHGQCHDFINLRVKTKEQILKTCTTFREHGLSLREIEERTGIAKTTIQEALRDIPKAVKRKSGYAPYGYIYFDGKLIPDPKEQLVLRKILKLRDLGKNYQVITNKLNTEKIKTRFGKKWVRSTIRFLILREKNKFHL